MALLHCTVRHPWCKDSLSIDCSKQNSLSETCEIAVMQASGWGIVIGFGAFFALFAGSLVYLDIAFSGEVCNAPCVSHC